MKRRVSAKYHGDDVTHDGRTTPALDLDDGFERSEQHDLGRRCQKTQILWRPEVEMG
jgi:hypothetical protein